MIKAPLLAAEDCRHARIINILSKVATDIPTPARTRMAACIVHKNEIISFGTNEMKTHPFQAKYSKNPEAVYLHAETAAIKNAIKLISTADFAESDLYICRVKYYDFSRRRLEFGLAKPCHGCMRCINSFSIRSVVYSLDRTGFAILED